jgi:hypothetical protein
MRSGERRYELSRFVALQVFVKYMLSIMATARAAFAALGTQFMRDWGREAGPSYGAGVTELRPLEEDARNNATG